MFVQIKNGRIVRVSEVCNGDDIEMELPEDFDYARIDRYEVVDGVLIKHDLPGSETNAEPTIKEQIAELREALDLLLSRVTE